MGETNKVQAGLAYVRHNNHVRFLDRADTHEYYQPHDTLQWHYILPQICGCDGPNSGCLVLAQGNYLEVDEVGPVNVVQIVTDNDFNYKKTYRLIAQGHHIIVR